MVHKEAPGPWGWRWPPGLHLSPHCAFPASPSLLFSPTPPPKKEFKYHSKQGIGLEFKAEI